MSSFYCPLKLYGYEFKLEDLEYTAFLLFTKEDDEKQYREYSKHQLYGPIYTLFVFLIFTVAFTRSNFPSGFYNSDPFFCLSTTLFTLTFIMLVIFIVGRHLDVLTGKKLPERIQKIFDFLINYIFQNELESITCVVSNFSFITALIARVLKGECHQNVTYFEALSCNPLAQANSPPIDSIILCFMSALFLQLFYKNLRKSTLLLVWLMTTITVFWSVIYLKAWTQSWLFTNVVTFAVLQYECERMQMSAFLKSKLAVEIEKLKQNILKREHNEKENIIRELGETKLKDEKSRVDMQIKELEGKNEIKLKEAETAQLRSLVGNVAHDLKTPIHSVSMDIDFLKNSYLDVLQRFPDVKTYFASKNEEMNPMSVFESLESSCKFMTMSLNRCLDYTKASSNIALRPVMETFNIMSTLIVPVRCIKHHLQKADQGRIKVKTLSDDICPNVISDKHWFSENLLCLLSNAIKYSDKGTIVDVLIELVPKNMILVTEDSCNMEPSNTPSSKQVERQNKDITNMIRVSVADEGVGISESGRRNLFQPFKQAQRMVGGTGLGLYSLAKRMEALHGSCGIKSRSDGRDGSVFWFAFPYRPDSSFEEVLPSPVLSPRQDLSQVSLPPVLSSTPNQLNQDTQNRFELTMPVHQSNSANSGTNVKPLRILVVDDSISILKITSRALRDKGHYVEVQENGSLGLARMKKALINQEFDVLLTDLQMPIMDGFLFVKRFREYEAEILADENHEHIGSLRKCNNNNGRFLIIGMSANSDDLSKQEAIKSGMDKFIGKPFVFDEFWNILRTYL